MIQVLTVTGARPAAFELCARWMREQVYRGTVRWRIVHDTDDFCAGGVDALRATLPSNWVVEAIRAPFTWVPGRNTQGANLALGCDGLDPDVPTAIVEDDDCYAPSYLAWAEGASRFGSIVGEPCARYYNVATRRWKEMSNRGHSSLCSTVVRGEALPLLRRIAETAPKFIDIELWRLASRRRLTDGTVRRVVGIKGLPGRAGIGCGHDAAFGRPDADGRKLVEWIGQERAKIYAKEVP